MLPLNCMLIRHLQSCSMSLISKMSEHLVIIKFYLNQRADKNIKADEQRALSCEMERQNLNYTRLDPFIIHKKIENYKARENNTTQCLRETGETKCMCMRVRRVITLVCVPVSECAVIIDL